MDKITQEYYVIEKDGKMFGIEYEDGNSTCEGFIDPHTESEYSISAPMEKVRKINEKTKKAIDSRGLTYLTYSGNEERFLEKLSGSRIRKVRVTTTIEFLE